MYVHRSNQIEALVDALAGVVSVPLADPMARECIVVQGRGMERWLSMQLSERTGVWANPDFPFLRHFLERAFDAVLGDRGAERWTPEVLAWCLSDLLRDWEKDDPGTLGPLRAYIGGEGGSGGPALEQRRRFELAERIATTFDRYTMHRPGLLSAWERGEPGAGGDEVDDRWQADLWRAVVDRLGNGHFAARAKAFLAQIGDGHGTIEGLPRRVSVFGVSSLPPSFVQVFGALAQRLEVHLFVPSPSREYWAEIRSQREILRELRERGASADDVEAAVELHLSEGNPLLASLGSLGRDFQQVLEGSCEYRESERDLYRDPGAGTMLAVLQSDILHLRRRGEGGEVSPAPIDPDDRSISIHACHSPMREVEVLHDQLRALFDDDPTLAPHDVVVMTPSIDVYAPFIEATFDPLFGAAGPETTSPLATGDGRPPQRIPCHVADRRMRSTHEVIDAFLRILDVAGGRLSQSDVLDLLGIDCVRRRFGLDGERLERVQRWLAEAGVRWGSDAEHRRSVHQPALGQNTWRFGLDRLLLGWAMPSGGRELFGGVLPYDGIDGGDGEILGELVELAEALAALHRRVAEPRPLREWPRELEAVLEALIARDDDNAHEHRMLRQVFADVVAAAEMARGSGGAEAGESAAREAAEDTIRLDALRVPLEARLRADPPARGFLSGGVTFCDMVPMRSIPFRVVCLLGMNDGVFPRLRRPPSFDHLARHRMPGDRNVRDDDRYLFLEALTAARERLIITYVGQRIVDNVEQPPSVVVAELLDAAVEGFVREAADATRPGPAGATVPAPLAPAPAADRRGQLAFTFEAPAPAALPVGDRRDAVVAHLVARHPLQPFSPRYFAAGDDRRLFSYAEHYCAGARTLSGPRKPAPLFIARPLPPLRTRGGDPIPVGELVRFFEHPSRAFLQRRLGIHLGRELDAVEDREPTELSPLAEWKLGDALLRRVLDGETLAAAFESVAATGLLPPGAPGRCAWEDLQPQVEIAVEAVRPWIGPERLEPVEVDHHVGGARVVGVLRDVWPAGQLHYGFSKLGRRSELSVWIRHVLLCLAAPEGYPRVSRITGRPPADGAGSMIELTKVDHPLAVLEALVRLYQIGQRVPLPLFPDASRAYVDKLRSSATPDEALDAAARVYKFGRWRVAPEKDDPYVSHIFAGIDPTERAYGLFDDDSDADDPVRAPGFEEASQTVFGPMLDHRREAAR